MQSAEENWEYGEEIATAFEVRSADWTPGCIEPETLLDLLEQKSAHPDANRLLAHIASCAFCSHEFRETRYVWEQRKSAQPALASSSPVMAPALEPDSEQPMPDISSRRGTFWQWWRQHWLQPALALGTAAVLLIFTAIWFHPRQRDIDINAVAAQVETLIAQFTPKSGAASNLAMRGDKTGKGISLESPVASAVLSDNVTLRWKPVSGASYRVTVQEEATRKNVGPDKNLTVPFWTVTLARDKTYLWQVVAQGDRTQASPIAQFHIVSVAEAQQIETNRQKLQNRPYLLGVFYAQRGLFEEAEQTLRTVSPADPNYAPARQLLDKLGQRYAR